MIDLATRSCPGPVRAPESRARNRSLPRSILPAIGIALGCMFSGASHAQTDAERIKELERKLEQSLKTIEALGARVKELENRVGGSSDGAPAAPPSPATATAGAAGESAEHEHARKPTPDAGAAAFQPPIVLRGFADVGAGYTSESGKNKGFVDGSLDFYLTPRLSENVKSVIELVFEHDINGNLEADLERLQIGYTWNDKASVWLGRFHSPLGYWNTEYHHGSELQTSVLRPQMIAFEDQGGVVPAHTVGLWGTGAVRVGAGKATYDLIVGNSPAIKDGELDPNNVGSKNFAWSSGFNFGYVFGGAAEGLKVGVDGYHAEVSTTSTPTITTRMNILGVYAATEGDLWELNAEYYRWYNQDISGGTGNYQSWGGFAQLGRHIGDWTPYARVEQGIFNQQDNYFALLDGGRSYSLQAVGLRYELTSNSALKFEADHVRTRTTPPTSSFNRLLMQWAMRF